MYTYAHIYEYPSFGILPESGGYARMKYVSDPVKLEKDGILSFEEINDKSWH